MSYDPDLQDNIGCLGLVVGLLFVISINAFYFQYGDRIGDRLRRTFNATSYNTREGCIEFIVEQGDLAYCSPVQKCDTAKNCIVISWAVKGGWPVFDAQEYLDPGVTDYSRLPIGSEKAFFGSTYRWTGKRFELVPEPTEK